MNNQFVIAIMAAILSCGYKGSTKRPTEQEIIDEALSLMAAVEYRFTNRPKDKDQP